MVYDESRNQNVTIFNCEIHHKDVDIDMVIAQFVDL